MIIDVEVDKLFVISDLHVGHPFSQAGDRIVDFLKHANREGFDLCINGDGFEILQASFLKLAGDSIEILDQIRGLIDGGRRVYYVVGNHDIVLEHFLESWLVGHICPFLNVRSGDRRIRIEHAHLYDPFFVKHPDLYEVMTRLAGPLLYVYPDVYYLWSYCQGLKDRWVRDKATDPKQASVYYEAAQMLCKRGFDTVVFGHTHNPRVLDLGDGRSYVNSGNWMRGSDYVRIEGGSVTLETWQSAA